MQQIGEKRPPLEHWSDRPTFASPTKILMVFLATIICFGSIFATRAYLGWGDLTGKSLLITYHGQRKSIGSNDVFVYRLQHYGDHRKLSATHGFPLFGLENIYNEHVQGLRAPYYFNDSLYVTNAYRKDSKIWEYKNVCAPHENGWDNTNDLVVFRHMETCVHPYGIKVYPEKSEAYVSCQTSGHVEKYDLHDPNAPGEVILKPPKHPTFSSSGFPMDQLRDIALAPKRDLIFLSDRFNRSVTMLKLSDPKVEMGSLYVYKPIGLVVDDKQDRLYVGSVATGEILIFDLETLKLVGSIKHRHMTHPAGLIIDDDLLYVVCQDSLRVYSFDLSKENPSDHSHLVIGQLHKRPEGIAMVPCVPAVQTTPS